MKIIFSNFDDIKNPYYGGGGALSIHEVAKRLAKNHQITILTGRYPDSKDEEVDGVNYKRIGFFGSFPKIAQAIFQVLLPFYVMTLDFDVWVESFTPPFSTAFLPWFTRRTVIGLTQLLGAEDMSRKYYLPFHIIENFGLKYYKYFIVLTNELKEIIEKQNRGAHIKVIPNGIDDSLIHSEVLQKPDEHILYLGRIDREQKGLDLLLEAYSQIRESIVLPLIIAGNGPKREIEWMKSKIEELGLTKQISMVGRVEGDKKMELLKKSAFVVMPSRFETMGIIALEAFALKSPLVIFDIPSLNWIPKDYAIRVPAYDTNLLAEGMLKFASNKGLRNSMGEHARGFALEYDFNKVADQYNHFILESKT